MLKLEGPGLTGHSRPKACRWWGKMGLRKRLAVDGGSPAAHPQAYGTALDNVFCRSGVPRERGVGEGYNITKNICLQSLPFCGFGAFVHSLR